MDKKFMVNSNYTPEKFQKNFLNHFRACDEKKVTNFNGVQIIHEPFDCAIFPNFLDTEYDSNLINALESEVRRLPLHRRQNDLFSLHQSDDLKSLLKNEKNASEFPLLRQLQQFFATDMLTWMQKITGAELDKEDVNSTVSRYEPNDYLLCHDDELERRRIAFIIYLVPEDWCASVEGGCLDMIECGPTPSNNRVPKTSGDYHPWRPVVSLPPRRNCLAFFEVCSKSFHQVTEIIGTRDRLSVHGWFMSDPLPRTPRNHDPLTIPRLHPCFIEEELVYKWVNPIYLVMEQQQAILRRFVSTSEIRLPNFLRKSEWKALCKGLRSIESRAWMHEGPMDLRNISVLPYTGDNDNLESSLPEPCQQMRRLLRSEAMLVILSQLTGVTLHSLGGCEEDDGIGESTVSKRRRSDMEEDKTEADPQTELSTPRFHRWKSGMYTLLADADSTVLTSDDKNEKGEDKPKWRLDLLYHIAGYGTHETDKKKMKADRSSGDEKNTNITNPHWNSSWNGQIIYTSRSDNEEIVRVNPEDNALTLVYCDSDAGRFVRYLNSRAKPILSGDSGDEVSDIVPTPFAYDVFVSYFDPLPNHDDDEEEEDVDSSDDDFDEEDESFGSQEEDASHEEESKSELS